MQTMDSTGFRVGFHQNIGAEKDQATEADFLPMREPSAFHFDRISTPETPLGSVNLQQEHCATLAILKLIDAATAWVRYRLGAIAPRLADLFARLGLEKVAQPP